MFKKAEKTKLKLRLAIDGASGSGKTWGALTIAASLGGKIAVIDTEHGSASLYSDKFNFDVMELNSDFAPEKYIAGIKGAEKAGYDVLIIDSLSHEWEGPGGCLDIQNRLGGRYTDWGKVTPRHDALIQAILGSNMHVIATMRTKAEYIIEKNQNAKDAPRKVGTAPKQRDGVEYEFSAVFNLNQQHMASVSKDRTSLFDGRDFMLDESVGKSLIEWLENGVTPPTEEEKQAAIEAERQEWVDKINAQQTIDGLRSIWPTFPKHLKAELGAIATERSHALTPKQEAEKRIAEMKAFPMDAVMQSIAADLTKADVKLKITRPEQREERIEFLRSLPKQSHDSALGQGALYNRLNKGD